MTITVTMLQTRQGEGGAMWLAGQTYDASDPFATMLIVANLATGTLPVVPVSALSAAQIALAATLLSPPGAIGTSRQALPADNGATLALGAGATYTIADASLLSAGLLLQGTAMGGGTIAVASSVTLNGSTASITLTARQFALLLPTPGSPSDRSERRT